MYWEKEIRIRLSTRRILGGIMATMSIVNLLIVGTVFNSANPSASSIATSTPTASPPLGTQLTPSLIVSMNTFTPVPSPTNTVTQTSSPTPTHTSTLTVTSPVLPSPTPCILRTFWPVYVIRKGDTLFSLARATGSTVEDLKLANCLYSDRIYVDQPIYVPHLPINSSTFTPSITPSETDPPSPTPCIPMKSWPSYRVQPGDTLDSIARRTHSVAWQLMQANCLPNEYIYVGQLLFVPILPVTTQAPATGPIPTDTSSVTPTNTPSIYLKFSPTSPPLFQIIK